MNNKTALENSFKDQQKLRKARVVTPPNTIKQKVGTGGLDKSVLAKAEEVIDNNTIDFKPIAENILQELEILIGKMRATPENETLVEDMLYAAAQFKAQGSMFRYPLVSDMGNTLVNFLEAVTLPASAAVADIVSAHKKAITFIIHSGIHEPDHAMGKELLKSLIDACDRYFKSRKA